MKTLFKRRRYFAPALLLTLIFLGVPEFAHAGFISDAIGFGTDALMAPIAYMAQMVLQLANLLVWLAGVLLNNVIRFTVIDMKTNLDTASVVNDAWKVIRDVCNMLFIFVLVYSAIRTMLGMDRSAKELIKNIVIVAVLINFSLFFTKFVIDASNLVSLTFYDAIAPGQQTGAMSYLGYGIADALISPMRLQTIFAIAENNSILNSKVLLVIGVMGTVFSLTAAFVLFSVAMMFIIRFVTLIFVMALSPLAFMSLLLPQAKGLRDQWLNALIGQAVFAPLYFMLTWIVILFARGLFSNNTGSLVEAFTAIVNGTAPAGPGAVTTIMNFIIITAMLIASLTISKKWANSSHSVVANLNNWATGKAGNMSFGLAGRMARGTVGRAAEEFKNTSAYRALQVNASKGGVVGSLASRAALGATGKVASGSYDIRGTRFGGVVGAGAAGGQGGYQAQLDKKEKEKKDRAKTAGVAQNRINLDNAMDMPVGTARTSAIDQLAGNIKKLSDADIVKLPASYMSDAEFAKHLKAGQADVVNASDNYSAPEKAAFMQARHDGITNPVTGAITRAHIPDARKILTNLSAKEITKLGLSALSDKTLIQAYTPPMLRRMAAEMDGAEVTALRAAILAATPTPPSHSWLTSADGQSVFS